MKRKTPSSVTFTSLVFAMVFGFIGALLFFEVLQVTDGALPFAKVEQKFVLAEDEKIVSAIEKVSDSVVSIVAVKAVPIVDFEGGDSGAVLELDFREVSGASGFIVDQSGII
ncbi:hypothetical protein KJ632_01550, partial [Patescibacteria group bacterium]|nr:hypothetical protein [Patescibacteria group bacterium]